jgi:hypothetical protein
MDSDWRLRSLRCIETKKFEFMKGLTASCQRWVCWPFCGWAGEQPLGKTCLDIDSSDRIGGDVYADFDTTVLTTYGEA